MVSRSRSGCWSGPRVDIDLKELTVGVSDLESKLAGLLKTKGVPVFGVRKACDKAVTRIDAALKVGK